AVSPLSGSDCLYVHGFTFAFTPLPGCFSPFPHGTGSLSVAREYLALGGGPPGFPRGFPCPVVLGVRPGGRIVSTTGLLPSTAGRSRPLRLRFAFLTPCRTPHNPEGPHPSV